MLLLYTDLQEAIHELLKGGDRIGRPHEEEVKALLAESGLIDSLAENVISMSVADEKDKVKNKSQPMCVLCVGVLFKAVVVLKLTMIFELDIRIQSTQRKHLD